MVVPVGPGSSVLEAQTVLRTRLCGQVLPPIIHGYESERKQLYGLIERTATAGESNSILVIGPRGSGKTMLLNSVLEELQERRDVEDNLIQVTLNGLLQTNDRIALKEITRQMHLENSVGDRVFGSFAENLQFLLEALKSGGRHTKSILFVLDEFDLFAHHKNQTLLYNLFDVAQSAQAPICVIGLTVRLDVIELLEKRVKSRFSHRQLHLLPTLTFDTYLDVFASCLRLPDTFGDKKFCREWNKRVKELQNDSTVQDILRRQFNTDMDIRALHKLMLLPVCNISTDHSLLEAGDFVDSSRHQKADSKAATLHGLSVLELCLVIAMKHLNEIYDGEPFNFEMVFREYQKFAQRRSSMQMFEKPVVLKAFEHLCALELVLPSEGTTGRVQKEYRLMTLLVDATQVMETLQKYPGCPTEVKQWGVSSLG